MEHFSERSQSRVKSLYEQAKEATDVNLVYQLTVEALHMCGFSNELPRVVVFGQQSMGKTTLLDVLLGGPFGYVSSEIGTKMPIEITMKPSTTKSVRVCVRDPLEGQEVHEFTDLADLAVYMENKMAATTRIRSEELMITIEAPNAPHLVLVDLPGIKIDVADDARLTQQVVKNFVAQNPNNLYIMVKRSSDDPGNWPYELKNFILKPLSEGGLGLKPDQTVTVGTRTLQFLQESIKEVPTLNGIYERALRRGVLEKDSTTLDRPLVAADLRFRLHLVELFTMSANERATLSYAAKKSKMQMILNQVQNECDTLIESMSDTGSASDKQRLLDMCSLDKMADEIQSMINNLIRSRLDESRRRLTTTRKSRIEEARKLMCSSRRKINVEEDLRNVFEILQNQVTQLCKGSHEMALKGGTKFLNAFGATLMDDLKAGDELARCLATTLRNGGVVCSATKDVDSILMAYPNDFLTKALEFMDTAAANIYNSQYEQSAIAYQSRELAEYQEACEDTLPEVGETLRQNTRCPSPSIYNKVSLGQFVRYTTCDDKKECLTLVGFVTGLIKQVGMVNREEVVKELVAVEWCCPQLDDGVTWRHTDMSWWKKTRFRARNVRETIPVMPMAYFKHVNVTENGLFGWRLCIKDWAMLEPVIIRSIKWSRDVKNYFNNDPPYISSGTAVVQPCLFSQEVKKAKFWRPTHTFEEADCPWQLLPEEEVPLAALFVDHSCRTTAALIKPADIVITGGQHANLRVANHLAYKRVSKWLESLIPSLTLDVELSDDEIGQQTRSVDYVNDANQIEPLMVMLIKLYAQNVIYPLIILATCANIAATRRITEAAYHEMIACIPQSVNYIRDAPRLATFIKTTLQTFSELLGTSCIQQMVDAISDSCASLTKSSISTALYQCSMLEKSLSDHNEQYQMPKIIHSIHQKMLIKKQLSQLDGRSVRMAIIDACAVHFWLAKLQLSIALPKVLSHCFNDYNNQELSSISLTRESLKIPNLLNYMLNALEEEVMPEQDESGFPRALNDEHITGFFDLIVPDHQTYIEKLSNEAVLLDYAMRTYDRLTELMNKTQLSFLKRSI